MGHKTIMSISKAAITSFFILAVCGILTTALQPINYQDNVRYSDCQKANDGGYKKSGYYVLWYQHTNTTLKQFTAECQMKGDTAYTVIQRRMNGNVSFYQSFAAYENGFGDYNGDFWQGLRIIHALTSSGHTVLTIHLQDWQSNSKNARYSNFQLLYPGYYRLQIGGFSSTDLYDDLSFNNGFDFATYDRPDHYKCAINQQAGWWFNYCTYALPNGLYYQYGPYTPSHGFYNGIYWKDWHGYGYSLKYFSMLLSTQ